MTDNKHIVVERGPKDALILHFLGDAFSGNARLTLEGDAESGDALLRYALKLNGTHAEPSTAPEFVDGPEYGPEAVGKVTKGGL